MNYKTFNNSMKNIICLLTLVLFGFGLSAQDVKIELGPEYKLSKKKLLAGHLHSNSSGHYMYFRERQGGFLSTKVTYVLEKYDPKLKQVFSKNYEVDKRNVFGLEMKYFKQKFAWLQYEKDLDADNLIYYITPINLKGKASKPKKIAKFKYERRSDMPIIDWEISNDTTSILFIAQDDRDRRKEDYQVYLSVLDNEFNKKWSKKVKLPYSQRQVIANSWTVTDEGDVYFLAKIYEDNKRRESKFGKGGKKAAYDMKLYKISADGSKNSFDLRLDDAFIKGMKIKPLENSEDIALIGFTGDSRNGPIQGATYMKMSGNDGSIIFAKKRNFTEDELDSFGRKNTSKDRNSRERGLDDEFIFKEIITSEDGSITAVAEEDIVIVRESVDANGNRNVRTTFKNNAIVVMDINPEGKVYNVGMIPKRQSNTKSGYPMANPKDEPKTDFQYYASFITEDRIYYLYNDDKDNFRKNITDPDRYRLLSSYNDAIAVLAHFDDNGKLVKKQLFSKKEAKTLLMPKHCSQIDENRMFFFNKKANFLGKSDFRFGILTIK